MLERSGLVCLLVRDPVSFPSRPCHHRKFSLVCTTVILSLSVVRYSILPPVLDELKINPKHVPPLRVGGQVGRPKGKPTRRKASNDEYNTHSRFNAVRVKTPSSTGSAQRKSADPVVAIDGV